jgi:hypothetical protein
MGETENVSSRSGASGGSMREGPTTLVPLGLFDGHQPVLPPRPAVLSGGTS